MIAVTLRTTTKVQSRAASKIKLIAVRLQPFLDPRVGSALDGFATIASSSQSTGSLRIAYLLQNGQATSVAAPVASAEGDSHCREPAAAADSRNPTPRTSDSMP